MMFYRITAESLNWNLPEERDRRKELLQNIQDLTEEYRMKHRKKTDANLFLSGSHGHHVTAGAAMRGGTPLPPDQIEAFFLHLGIAHGPLEIREITCKDFVKLLHSAENNDLLRDANDMADGLDMALWDSRFREKPPDERLLEPPVSKAALLQKARDLLCAETLVPELERIYAKPADGKTTGHPVHYLIQTDSQPIREQMIEILLSALYANGRIRSQRYICGSADHLLQRKWNNYDLSRGGSLVILHDQERVGSEYADDGMYEVIALSGLANRFKHEVLTIFCLPKASNRQKTLLMQNLKDLTLVELREDAVTPEQARGYLKRKAQKDGVPSDRSLYRPLRDHPDFFHPHELDELYSQWFSRRIKTHVYPQYAHLDTAGSKFAQEKPRGDAYSELRELIGLERAKGVIDQVLDYAKAQKLFKEQGLDQSHTALHMVFTGNPGSAKTTVARLFARIMRENKLLSVGSLIEVGRADLVGKYVGWTAKMVKDVFEKAKGSVLFIDEAYSLVDDKEGMYGDEAINTIVQEMENNREDMAVIFAGYPDKMERFLQRNPGLRSRIAFHVPFDDYSPDELCRITGLLASRQELKLSPGVEDKLLPIFEAASRADDFGNGRFARNLLEQARMRQASRLVRMDVDRVTRNDLSTLLPEDFEAPALRTEKQKRKIGFAV